MGYHQRQPPPPLDQYAQVLWTAERRFTSDGPAFDILPDSSVELIFNFGAPCWLDDGQQSCPAPRCYIVGLLERPLHLRADGLLQTVAARLFPWGLAPLLAEELETAHAPLRSLELLWSDLWATLERAVQTEGLAAALALLEQALLERARARRPPDADAPRALLSRPGQLSVRQLATQRHLSPRQIERRFRASVGVTPKALARLGRFQQARDRLYQHPDTDLATLAAECGYADQAHLTRDFKSFSRQTPGQFAQAVRQSRALLRDHGLGPGREAG